MEVKCRLMKESDWKEIKESFSQAWDIKKLVPKEELDKYCEYYCLSCYSHSTFCVVAEVEEKVVGFIMGRDNSLFKFNKEIEQKNGRLREELLKINETAILINTISNYYKKADEILKECHFKTKNEIVLLVVAEKYRGRGIGKQLIVETIELLKSNNQHDFYLITDTACNYQIYDRLGFTKYGNEPFTFILPNEEMNIRMMIYSHNF